MNENERIDTPNKNLKRVGALKMKTCVESTQKQSTGLVFNIQNS